VKRTAGIACAVACALAAPGAYAQTATLGRLFFTPQERARIASARVAEGTADATRAGADPQSFVVSGVARNSRGGLVAWIDGQAVPDGGGYAGYTVHVAGGGVTLRRAGQPAVWLPVGRPLPPSRPIGRLAANADAEVVSMAGTRGQRR